LLRHCPLNLRFQKQIYAGNQRPLPANRFSHDDKNTPANLRQINSPPAQLTLSKNNLAPETDTAKPPLAPLPPIKIPPPTYAVKPAWFQRNPPVTAKILQTL